MSKERARLDVANAANEMVIAELKNRIAELEKERDELKAHTVALEIDFDNALDVAQLCANNPSVVGANKSFQEFVSYTTIESTLEAHNLEQHDIAIRNAVKAVITPAIANHWNDDYQRGFMDCTTDILNQAKSLKDEGK